MRIAAAIAFTAALAGQSADLTPAQKALAPRLSAMRAKVDAQANALGMSGWPTFEGLEDAERKAIKEPYESIHFASHRQKPAMDLGEALVWDNPRVTWFRDGDRWDAALLMPDSRGSLHLAYLEDAFGAPNLKEVLVPQDGALEPDWVFKDAREYSFNFGPDYADGPGEPGFEWDAKLGLVTELADAEPTVFTKPDDVSEFDGFILKRGDLKGVRPTASGSYSVLFQVHGRWWTCPTEVWTRLVKAHVVAP